MQFSECYVCPQNSNSRLIQFWVHKKRCRELFHTVHVHLSLKTCMDVMSKYWSHLRAWMLPTLGLAEDCDLVAQKWCVDLMKTDENIDTIKSIPANTYWFLHGTNYDNQQALLTQLILDTWLSQLQQRGVWKQGWHKNTFTWRLGGCPNTSNTKTASSGLHHNMLAFRGIKKLIITYDSLLFLTKKTKTMM